MSFLKQTDFARGSTIMLFGCRFMCCLYMAHKYMDLMNLRPRTVTIQEAQNLYDQCVTKGFITGNSFVRNDDNVINEALTFLGAPQLQSVQTGTTQNHANAAVVDLQRPNFFGNLREFNFTILRYATNQDEINRGNPTQWHFVVGDNQGNEIYDPWDETRFGRLKLRFYQFILYRLRRRA